jgi:hypothetical protein
MRYLFAVLAMMGVLAAPALAAPPGQVEFSSLDIVNRWMSNYRNKPQPARMPAAVRAMSQFGALKEPDGAGVYVGFIAGIIGFNPAKAEELIGKTLPLAPADQWFIVKSIAYSGHREWKELLVKFADRLPERRVMIDRYLEGKLQILDQIPLEKKQPTLWEKARGAFTSDTSPKLAAELTYDRSPELLDTLWGYYFASGSFGPIARIIVLLPWTNDRDSVEKLTVGSMAKYTLASNAARDPALLALLKGASKNQPANVAPVLAEVINAADVMETTRLRKDALASIEELKRKGPGYKRDISTWGQIGQGALALGCIAAATVGAVALGIPCVVGGAASSAALHYWNNNQ